MEKQKLPNATPTLVLGILAFLTFCCYGIFSILFGVIGLILSSKDAKRLRENPDGYDNVSTHKIGKVLSIIGIALGVLALIFYIWLIIKIGPENMQNEEQMRRRMEEVFNIR
ncbi:MAG: hypothetical protein RLZZ500_739 [Bacteroidota bacterium]|jgi:hypothetical protein